MDVTVYHDGVHADLNETFLVGNVDEEGINLVKTTYECLMKAIDACEFSLRVAEISALSLGLGRWRIETTALPLCRWTLPEHTPCAPAHARGMLHVAQASPGCATATLARSSQSTRGNKNSQS